MKIVLLVTTILILTLSGCFPKNLNKDIQLNKEFTTSYFIGTTLPNFELSFVNEGTYETNYYVDYGSLDMTKAGTYQVVITITERNREYNFKEIYLEIIIYNQKL